VPRATVLIEEAKIPDELGLMVVAPNGMKIRVFRMNGGYQALANVCPHEGGPVCEGTVTGMLSQGEETEWKLEWVKEGQILYCPWHGTAFDITTGKSIVRQGLCIKAYPLKVQDGKVQLEV
jgi:nitrite reductase/ring-hydroxylating ferredoxin subunit